MDTLETLVVQIEKDINRDVMLRTARALEFLVGKIKEAYAKELTATHGASGAIGALNYEVQRAAKFIEAIVGVSTANAYLANLEFGERGTQGGSGLFTRSKAPRIRNIAEWIRLANLKIEDTSVAKKRADRYKAMSESTHRHPSFDKNKDKPWYSTEPIIQLAFMIAMKRKKFGIKALHVIDRISREYANKITSYLEGQTG